MSNDHPSSNAAAAAAAGSSNPDHVSTDATLQEVTTILSKISSVKKKVEADRSDYIKKRMEENRMKLAETTKNNYMMSVERTIPWIVDGCKSDMLLTKKQIRATDMLLNINPDGSSQDHDEHAAASVDLLRFKLPKTNCVQPVHLPKVEKIPPYTTWTFVDRNQMMTEDQSIAGQRRIYYERKVGKGYREALVCSDSEEDTDEDEVKDDKKEFVKSEDNFIWSTIEQTGPSDNVYDLLAQRMSRKSSEIKERYEYLKCPEPSKADFHTNSYLDKDLETAQHTFDTLFCRQCLIFDCKSHRWSQPTFPIEKKHDSWESMNEESAPCGPNCYLWVVVARRLKGNAHIPPVQLKTEQTLTGSKSWRTLEKSLFEKGLEIFGPNSCLIARNVMGGHKTCDEVYQYHVENKNINSQDDDDMADQLNHNMGINAKRSSKLDHKRGRFHHAKCTRKSTNYVHSLLNQNFDGKELHRRQYNPCACQVVCKDDCSCVANGTGCEKYCGCPKTCRARFRGCSCTKSQCKSRQCPCFAANRECDPDVCQHCLKSWSEETHERSEKQGSNYECHNMKLLLRQHERILLGRSEVSGWGAFLKYDVAKDDYLGEYTGELISHHEADKRGKIYDRENLSFLFDLNDQYVLDAYRKGSKLKFPNHSSKPNCYAKVMMVAGDHRVGIFAKEKICAGEELFIDYRYEEDTAPSWARKSRDHGSRRDDNASSKERAMKFA